MPYLEFFMQRQLLIPTQLICKVMYNDRSIAFRPVAAAVAFRLSHQYFAIDFVYSTGMNLIAAFLLLHMDEEHAFWTMLALWKRLALEKYFADMSTVSEAMIEMGNMMCVKFPDLTEHMGRECLQTFTYATPWFLTLFLYNVEATFAARIWDAMILDFDPLRLDRTEPQHSHDSIDSKVRDDGASHSATNAKTWNPADSSRRSRKASKQIDVIELRGLRSAVHVDWTIYNVVDESKLRGDDFVFRFGIAYIEFYHEELMSSDFEAGNKLLSTMRVDDRSLAIILDRAMALDIASLRERVRMHDQTIS
jgi:Rab-GTPase-TBC domain